LSQVGTQVADVVDQLRKQAEDAAQSLGERQKSFEAATGNAVMGMSEHMDQLLAQSVETHRSLQDAITKLTGTTTEAIGRMNQGADTLLAASTEFAKASQGVADTMNASTVAVGEIKTATSSLASAAGAVKDVVADSARTRDAIANMVSDLRQVTENAKREAGVTAVAIARIESAAAKLGEAQLKADDYLQGVNRVLSETHKVFADNVAQSLRIHNSLFQEELRRPWIWFLRQFVT
jgi:ABC-type transporter Mla subunit MlaD